MSSLTIEQRGQRSGGTLSGRILIGRWPDNGIVIDDKAVSRIHAWVGVQKGQYYIADAGSRTGTFVNGQTLHERQVLQDGDEIRIGPATLWYSAGDVLPPDAAEIDLTPRSPEQLSSEQGVFLDCMCGAPLWIPREFVGVGQCRYCGHTITQGPAIQGPTPVQPPVARGEEIEQERAGAPPAEVIAPPARNADDDYFETLMDDALAAPEPLPAPRSAAGGRAGLASPLVRPPSNGAAVALPTPSANGANAAQHVCGVCHAPMTAFDEIATCPSCGLAFHGSCWTENLGCSAYGCPQVGALAEKE